ncbi:hypothetical protein C900_05287 [Fulvivirga imtechensis AK7]|uniref:Class I lanthipeptide n=1 Tax=Fulvivirga imtechensis AK7 TaxID=1237149 RepID=L8JJY3_9BACT|nr:pinensin family lanthipeptide [Fulvivirga imtechensis]ELR69216.1 hypothetical protein C900_05287 [Fulvivirga imtechensis AK7]
MKQKKLKLEALKLKSFITTEERLKAQTIKGGAPISAYGNCEPLPYSELCIVTCLCSNTCMTDLCGDTGGGASGICDGTTTQQQK